MRRLKPWRLLADVTAMKAWHALAVAALALASAMPASAGEADEAPRGAEIAHHEAGEPDDAVGPGAWQMLHARETMTGNWGGFRPYLTEAGVDLTMLYTGDTIGVVHGGLRRRTTYLGSLELLLTVDANKLVGWKGGSVFLYAIDTHGHSPSENVGEIQAVDNIDVPTDMRLAEAWVQQKLFDDRFSLIFGLYDVNSEFDLLESAELFLNYSFGMGPEYSQTGVNGPSTFPNTSLGLRLRLNDLLYDGSYLEGAALDGVAGDPHDPSGTGVHLSVHDGALLTGEVGWRRGVEDHTLPYTKLGLGGWLYTASFDTLHGGPQTVRRANGNGGVYGIGEWQLWQEPDGGGEQGVTLFGRVGWADTRFNPIGWFVSGGVNWTGALPSRDEDALGFGVSHTFDSDHFRSAQAAQGERPAGDETALELTYAAQLFPWLTLQPDLQYIVNPASAAGIPDAFVIGGRFGIKF